MVPLLVGGANSATMSGGSGGTVAQHSTSYSGTRYLGGLTA